MLRENPTFGKLSNRRTVHSGTVVYGTTANRIVQAVCHRCKCLAEGTGVASHQKRLERAVQGIISDRPKDEAFTAGATHCRGTLLTMFAVSSNSSVRTMASTFTAKAVVASALPYILAFHRGTCTGKRVTLNYLTKLSGYIYFSYFILILKNRNSANSSKITIALRSRLYQAVRWREGNPLRLG